MKWVVYLLVAANVGFFAWRVRFVTPEVPAISVQAPIPGHVTRLLLLSEVERGELHERAPGPEPEPAPPAPAPDLEVAASDVPSVAEVLAAPEPALGVCFMVGPLADADEVGRVSEWLKAYGGEPALREGVRREVSVYWVYFPPFPTPEEATARREEMLARGLEDIHVIPRGDKANAISLGVYSQRASLERRMKQLQDLGYSPSMVPRYRNTKAAWFDVSFEPGFEFPEEQFVRQFPDAAASPMNCPRAAAARPDLPPT